MSLHSWDLTLDIGSGGGAEPAAMWDSADLFDTFMEPCSLSSECILCGSWNRSKTSLKLFLSDQLPYLLSLGWPYTMLWPAEPEGSPLECSLEASMPVRLGQKRRTTGNLVSNMGIRLWRANSLGSQIILVRDCSYSVQKHLLFPFGSKASDPRGYRFEFFSNASSLLWTG